MYKIVKSLSENRILHSSLVLFFSAQAIFASDIKIQSKLTLTSESILNGIDQSILQNSVFEKVLIGLKYEAEVPIVVDQLNLKFQMSGAKTQIQKDSELNYFSTNMPEIKISAHISNLQIHGIIDKIISGAHVKIKIDSDCKNISFDALLTENNFYTQIIRNAAETKYQYRDIKMNFNPFSCTQVHGIEDFVTDIAIRSLQDKLQLQNLVGEAVSKILNDKLNNLKSDGIQQANLFIQKIDSEATLMLGQSQLRSDEIQTPIEIQTSSDQQYRASDIMLATNKTNHTSNALVINKSDLEFLIQNAAAKKLKKIQYSSDEIPELKKLLQSRFKQFFIWPALMKRPKNLPLTLVPALESFSFNLPTEKETNQINFKIKVGHWIQDQKLPMVYFRSEADLYAQSTEKLTVAKLSNSYVWDQSYVSKNNVLERISLNLVNSAAQNLLQNTLNNQILSAQDSFLKNLKSVYLSKEGVLEIFLK